jgi:N-acetylglucosamine repressor
VKKSDTEQIRQENKKQIIETLRSRGAMARVDLRKLVNLSPATVTAITADLINDGIIQEVSGDGSPAVGRGRPRVLIDLVKDSVLVLGVKLSMNEIRIMLGDIKGNIINESIIEVQTLKFDESALLLSLETTIGGFISALPSSQSSKIKAIGVAVQGFVDTNKGDIVWSPALSFRHVSITQQLEQHFQLPVTLANDANCIAIAISNQPAYQALQNYVVIMLGYGVGMGMILNGRLYSGHHGAASEFGHTKYETDGAQCQCGKRGCIEAYVSDYALYNDASAMSLLPRVDQLHPSESEMLLLNQMAENKDLNILSLFERAGRVLGYGIANILALISPEKVIISGPGIRAFPYMRSGLMSGLENALVPELIAQTQIEPFEWQEDLTGKGVLVLALKSID